MDVNEIQTVHSRERQTDSLQQLRDSFYEEAGQFVRSLRQEREQAAARADDPFDSSEVGQLSDDIATAEQTLEAIYERRVGKIVKMASLAAADMPTEENGLTTEERDLYENLLSAIETNRERVMTVLDGDVTDVEFDVPTPEDETTAGRPGQSQAGPAQSGQANATEKSPEPPDSDVSAADLMGGDAGEGDLEPASKPDRSTETEEDPDSDAAGDTDSASSTRGDGGPVGPSARSDDGTVDSESKPSENDTIDRTTVRITEDVGEILGVDDRSYELAVNDVITLPSRNATPLLEQGAAERLE